MSGVWGKKIDSGVAAAPAASAPAVSSAASAVVSDGNSVGGGGHGGPMEGSSGVGRVKAVLSGDSFVVWLQSKQPNQGPPEELQITLSLLSAPRIARGKDAGTDQPWAWQSRESLRKLIQAKSVQFRIDYTHPTSGRQYAFVKTQDGVNVNVAVAASGWARVQEPKTGKGPRGPEHVAMLEAQEKAQESKIGIFNDDPDASNRSIRDVKEKFDSWVLFNDLKGQMPLHGVVEGVLDGTTVRVLLVPSFYSVVVRLAGVQSPIWTRGDDMSMRVAQPFAEQAKYLTEYCLLGRDVAVTVGGVNKDETFYGTVLFGGKNVAEELLKNGLAKFVQWSCPEQETGKFQQLEASAQQKSLGVHKGGAGGGAKGSSKDFNALVVDVRSGSRLTVEDDAHALHDVFFSSVIAPKLNPKNPKEDEPLGWESREFLRKKLIGKKVRVAFDYEKAGKSDLAEDQQPVRKFYSVYLQGKHVPLTMVEEGLGQVITHRREESRSREYSALMSAEEEAKKSQKGIWDPNKETKRLIDQSNLRANQARQYLRFLQKPGLAAVVEFVMNPVRLKLFVPELSVFISFTVAAVRAPWSDDEFGEEAAAWARRNFHQRQLEIDVQQVDKGGNFLGDAYFMKQNVALTLLEEGWASVNRGSDRHPSFALYQKAEQAAQVARKGIWRDWSPEKVVEDPLEKAAETAQLLVTDVVDGSLFFCQRVSEQNQKTMDSLMAELQRYNKDYVPPITPVRWERGMIGCARFAEDGLWYRVRVTDGPLDRRAKIHYIDFGNAEVRDERDLRPVPPTISSIPPQASPCRLALLRVPALVQDCGLESAQVLRELTFGKVLMAAIEYKEGEEFHVTLGDPQSGINVNKEMVRMGLATVRAKNMGKRFEKPIQQLLQAQDEARRQRLSLWRYGDILDASDDEDY